MCLTGGGGAKPRVPRVTPPPTTPPTAPTPPGGDRTAIEEVRRALTRRQGIWGNIRTTPRGDANYGLGGGYPTFGGGS
jgi:hypothetical protein